MVAVNSWSTEKQLEWVTVAHRNNELVKGHIRSLTKMELNGAKVETLIVALPNGITAFCPVTEFGQRKYRFYEDFVGETRDFKVVRIMQAEGIVILSEREASQELKEQFLNELETLKANNTLEQKVFKGVVTSYNRPKGTIHVRVQGQDCYMFRSEWAWERNTIVDAQVGEEIEVKVLLFNRESNIVRVSRRLALPDPYAFIRTLKMNQVLAARVVEVHPIHGIYVDIENGVTLKAGKRRQLEEPEVGDHVRVRFQRFDEEKRQGRVTILDYPNGKRKKKDLGSFLFD